MRPSQLLHYDYSVAKLFMFATILFGIIGMVVGVVIAFQMACPELNYIAGEYSAFGRLRPLHTNGIIFGFMLSGIFATWYYIGQRVLKVSMSESPFLMFIGKLHFWLYMLVLVLAVVTLFMGESTAKEYAELEWPLDIPTEFTYYKGSEYPNTKYANHDEVRVVTFGDIDSQPCGTPHVNNVNQIGSFIILGSEKTSRGTRIYTTVSWATNIKLKKYYNLIQELRKMLNGKEDDILENIQTLRNTNKTYKKQIEELQKELTAYKIKEILQMEDTVLVDVVNASQLRTVSQALLNEVSSTKILMTTSNDNNDFAIISPEGKARDIYALIQKPLEASGGGSPKIVTARSSKPKQEVIELLQKNI